MKKHHTQMTGAEIRYCRRLVLQNTKWSLAPHACARWRYIDATRIIPFIRSGKWKVIEYHKHVRGARILIRGAYNSHRDLCVVVSVVSGVAVSAWHNAKTDQHAKLDMSAYMLKDFIEGR